MSEPIRIGHIGLSFHEASAIEVAKVLQTFGREVTYSSASHEAAFQMLERDEIDLLASAWLPSSHQVYLDPLLDDVEKLTVLYEPYCIWGVSNAVGEADVATISDLLREPALSKMERLIQGINPGAGISRFSAEVITSYGLDKAGYAFRPGTEADCFDRFEEANANGRWLVIPLWHPQFLHNRYSIRSINEPKKLLGGQDEATLIVRKGAKAKIGDPALAALSKLHIGNKELSALEDALIKSRT